MNILYRMSFKGEAQTVEVILHNLLMNKCSVNIGSEMQCFLVIRHFILFLQNT